MSKIRKKQTPILVIGMHRSGTSMVSNILSEMGIFMGNLEELQHANGFNVFGYYESEEIVNLNRDMLSSINSSWDHLPSEIDYRYLEQRFHRKAKRLIKSFKQRSFLYGFKDPQVSVLLPFWHSLLPHAKYIFCIRDPQSVAESLNRRDEKPIKQSLQIWKRYNESILEHIKNLSPDRYLIIRYKDIVKTPSSHVRRILKFLDIKKNKNQIEYLSSIPLPELRHNKGNIYKIKDRKIQTLWKHLLDIYKSNLSIYRLDLHQRETNQSEELKKLIIKLDKLVMQKHGEAGAVHLINNNLSQKIKYIKKENKDLKTKLLKSQIELNREKKTIQEFDKSIWGKIYNFFQQKVVYFNRKTAPNNTSHNSK